MVIMEIYVSPQCPHCRRLVDVLERYGTLFSDVELVVRYDIFPSKHYENLGDGTIIPIRIEGSESVSPKPLLYRLRRYGRAAEMVGGGVPQIRLKKYTRRGPITFNIVEAPPSGREKEWVLALRKLIEILDGIPYNI